MPGDNYDPFLIGPYPVGSRTWKAHDETRDRLFTCEIWYPAKPEAQGEADANGELRDAAPSPGAHPIIVFSHFSGGGRRVSSFLCRHLASHGYAVAALDHSEVAAPELAARPGETPEERDARIESIIASRVPDVRFLLSHLISGQSSQPRDLKNGTPPAAEHGPDAAPQSGGPHAAAEGGPGAAAKSGTHAAADIVLDIDRVGLVGHSFGGWTSLATPNLERRVHAIAAIAPGGNSKPMPGILPLRLEFAWGRDIPTLYLAADSDVAIPADGVAELFDRTPAVKRMFILQRADHQHFIDNVEMVHEAVRSMRFSGDAAWIPGAMRPITELCSGEAAHSFTCGLTLAHLDSALRERPEARQFLDGDVVAELAARGVEATEYGGTSRPLAPASPG
jgi:dienelactone hydrolase